MARNRLVFVKFGAGLTSRPIIQYLEIMYLKFMTFRLPKCTNSVVHWFRWISKRTLGVIDRGLTSFCITILSTLTAIRKLCNRVCVAIHMLRTVQLSLTRWVSSLDTLQLSTVHYYMYILLQMACLRNHYSLDLAQCASLSWQIQTKYLFLLEAFVF